MFDLLLALVDLAGVKLRSRLLTALNLLLSTATIACVEQLQVPAQLHEAAADIADALAVVMTEVGNGLEVGRKSTGQPHQLDVALRLALQPPAGRNAVQVAVDVELEQHRRVVRRPTGRGRLSAGEAQSPQIELFDEGVDRANRIVFGDVVVEIAPETT